MPSEDLPSDLEFMVVSALSYRNIFLNFYLFFLKKGFSEYLVCPIIGTVLIHMLIQISEHSSNVYWKPIVCQLLCYSQWI